MYLLHLHAYMIYIYIYNDRGKFQGRWIELTESNFRDEVTRRDSIVGLTKLVDGFATRTERSEDGQTLLSKRIERNGLLKLYITLVAST